MEGHYFKLRGEEKRHKLTSLFRSNNLYGFLFYNKTDLKISKFLNYNKTLETKQIYKIPKTNTNKPPPSRKDIHK